MSVLDAFDLAVCDDRWSGEAPDDLVQVASIAPVLRGRDADRAPAAVSAAVEAHASPVPRSLASTAEQGEARTILDPRARDVLRVRLRHDLRHWELAGAIGCSQMQVSRIIRTSLERLSAHASRACGGSSMSDPTEGATA